MSAIFRCFSGQNNNSDDDCSPETYNNDHKNGDNKIKKRKTKGKCKCSCEENNGDLTDGKGFSKTLHISKEKQKGKSPLSCCESSTSSDGNIPQYYTSLPSPTASVDPNGVPFFNEGAENLPGKGYMPVSKNDPFYNMNNPKRGKAFIFNFDKWDNTDIPSLGLSPRVGSKKDRNDLAKCLELLEFEVEIHNNVTNLEFWAVLEKVRKENHTDADCLLVSVMTHGEKNTIYMKDGTQIPINLVWENFEANRCPSLAGKPKIFIVQACRGKQYDSGTKLLPSKPTGGVALSTPSDVTDSANFSYVIPNAADIIVAFSCPLGHYSWRHPERGSWFIQSIVKVFSELAYKDGMDLHNLFTTVAREVALNYQSNTTNIESNNKKQVTSTSSTLIRTVIFRPKTTGSSKPTPVSLEEEMAIYGDGDRNNVHLQSIITTSHRNGNEVDIETEELKMVHHNSQLLQIKESEECGTQTSQQHEEN